jgi:N-acetylmuramoyl-L-alanine amidase
MAELTPIKRRILRQAVAENVDVLRGRRSSGGARVTRRVSSTARAFFFIALPLGLFASAFVIAQLADAWLLAGEPAMSSRVGQVLRPVLPRPEPGPPGETIATPAGRLEAIDPGVFPLAVRKIVLDPGHGGSNRGTVAPGGLVEKEITLDLARRLELLLLEAGFEVDLSRRADVPVSLQDRAKFGNEARADIFISIHVNWLETRSTRGVETYYLGPTDDPYLTRLAAHENQGSGYSLTDSRRLIERVYASARQSESRRLASEVQRALFMSLQTISPDLRNRGVKKAPFAVLIGTEMPAILAEVSCLSNEEERELLKTTEYRHYIAEALFEGIRSYSEFLNEVQLRGS